MNRNEWLASVKPGDQIVIMDDNYNTRTATVSHTTAGKIIVIEGDKRLTFWRESGERLGKEEFNGWKIYQPDSDDLTGTLELVRRDNLLPKIRDAIGRTSLATLEQIAKLLHIS